MTKQPFKKSLSDILAIAGVRINGPDPWDLQVHNEKFYHRVISHGSLGLGESYMDGWWDCERLDEFTFRVMRADLYKNAPIDFKVKIQMLMAKVFNMQARGKATDNAQRHYDIGNKLYQLMLDKRMAYTCAYW